MRKRILLLAVIAAFLAAQLTCSAVPRGIWKEGDIEARARGGESSGRRMLVASRSSEFKDALVRRMEKEFEGEGISMKIIGLQQLKEESAGDYDVVVLMNTCVAWSLDPQVDTFLHKHREAGNIIVVTTSGDGSWEPKKQNRDFDTVACASEMAGVDEVAGEVASKARRLLES